ncbi:MFS transporter [Ureibacillus acetophenoni]|uniref:Predicted MFS family arabinose efflux permease n=1 Tax=Ureibacillus acetophenoni TaxID=614649 RepID=A0A285UD98_9BACL|nr:MFS transporter [Ureibacillus acetophenoni]SOC39850.1 predicted MFS family arabinose efflux permease [Ureibacillus acetophenoni]
MKKEQLWTKDFIIISTINFLLALVFYLLIVIIGVYAVEEYQASTSEAGLVTGIFIVGALVGRLFIGRSINSIGLKKTLFIGLVFYLLTTSLYYIHFGIAFLIFTRFLHGIALGIASTATGTIVAQIIPKTRKGEGIGYYSMSSTLATAIGPFLGLLMTQYTSTNMIFSLCLVLGVNSVITTFFVNVPLLTNSSKATDIKGFKLSQFVEPKAVPIAVITLMLALCYSSVLSFINFYAIEINLVETASFFFLVYSIAVLISRPFTGRLMDLKGANYVMYPAFIIFTAGMILLGFSNNSFTLLLSGALIGLGFGNMQSCTQAIAIKLTPPERMGLATSTFFIFLDAGLGFGPYLLGLILPLTTYSNLYISLGILVLVSTGIYYLLHGKKDTITN